MPTLAFPLGSLTKLSRLRTPVRPPPSATMGPHAEGRHANSKQPRRHESPTAVPGSNPQAGLRGFEFDPVALDLFEHLFQVHARGEAGAVDLVVEGFQQFQ